MWLDNTGQEAVRLFWERCGEVESFPRSLEHSVALALPLRVVKLSHLRLSAVEDWLTRRGAPFHFNCHSRAVRGCLIASGGGGFVFVDGADPEDEQRFTVAHEAAHFLVDYLRRRDTAIRRFGPRIVEVFDGLRSPTVTERIHALLSGAPLGVYTNLMERDEAGVGFDAGVWEIEDRADKVALALLAPPEAVLSEANTSAARFAERRETIVGLLCGRYGLPPGVSDAYGRLLLIEAGRGPSWSESLRPV